MDNFKERQKENYQKFSNSVSTTITANIKSFEGHEKLVESYSRIAALNALKVDLIQPNFPTGAAQFFYEAHNDALLSHVSASFGCWRPALQSLRSFIENTLAAIYYLDHPVEFTKWSDGKFQISPRELRDYTIEHPRLHTLVKKLDLKSELDSEYSTLSKAVHGSSILFRMTTNDATTKIANPTISDLGKWHTRERCAFNACITPLLGILAQYLDGAKMQSLRTALHITVSEKSRQALKKSFDITL